MASSSYTDSILLFGDSLTQAWSDGSLAQRMAEYYLRRCDIINRGFGGYNSEWGIPVLEQVFATKEAREKGQAQNVKLMTIWFGANDACLPGSPQHVPIPQFKSNLSTLISMINSPSSTHYSPDTKIVLITAPPIILADWHAVRIGQWQASGSGGEAPKPDRDPLVTKQYAAAVREVAAQENVPVVNLWQEVVDAAGGEKDDQLRPFFYDGLHLTSQGYLVLFNALRKVILENYPELDPETMPMRMPHWADIEPTKPRTAIDKVTQRRLAGEL